MKAILLILITFSLTYADFTRFTRSNEMVADAATGLVWQDDATPTPMTWQGAINYCEALTLGEESDWRLPNINELTSIDDDTVYNPSISNIFVNSVSSHYWSSTTNALNASYAWIVYFSNGYQYSYLKTNNFYVRCVRAGQ